MVGHQAIAEQANGVFGKCFVEDPFKGVLIAVLLEQGQAGYAAIEGVRDVTTGSGARLSGHGEESTTATTTRPEKCPHPPFRSRKRTAVIPC